MSFNDVISITDEKREQWNIIKRACKRYNIIFSQLVVDSVINEFENGGWSKFVEYKEAKEVKRNE